MYSDTRLTKFLVKDLISFTKKTLPQSGLPKHILGTFIYVLYLDCFYVLHRCTYWWYPCSSCSSWSSVIQGVLRIKTCKLKLSYTTCVSSSRYRVHVTKSSLCSLQCSSVEFWVVYGITRVQFVEQLNCTSGSRRRWLTGWILLPNDNDKWFSYTG